MCYYNPALEIPDRKWGSVSTDQMDKLPTAVVCDSIAVYVNHFITKKMHCQPTHTNVKAPQLIKILFDTAIRLDGLPDDIVSNPKSTGQIWRALSFKHVYV